MNELINKENEWIIHFMGSLDRLLDNVEHYRQLSPDTERGAFLHRQGGVGSVEGEPPDTSGLPQRGTHSLHPVGRQNLLPLHPCIGNRRLTG